VNARPRVLFVGRTRYRLPLDRSLRRKWDALGAELDLRVLASAANGSEGADARFRLVSPGPGRLDGALFYVSLPARIARELRSFEPDVILAETPHAAFAAEVARAATRSRARVVAELHGDWRTATRLYGSPLRRLVTPAADAVARTAIRRADGVRAVSDSTAALARAIGVDATSIFPTWTDLATFLERPPTPLPAGRDALFVGALEPTKNVAGLADAWRAAGPRLPHARLRIVGDGSQRAVVEALVAELPEQTTWTPQLAPADVATALDHAVVLVLPSLSEGLPRVVIEALARGRPVVSTRVGGIPDLVADGVNGLLVAPGDAAALEDALVRVLGDDAMLERLAGATRASIDGRLWTADEYAERMRELVDRVLAR
jgi:glycosyltransferase involved in cell wall biosynthesis